MEDVLRWAMNQGFSIFVAAWLLIRIERVISEHTKAIQELLIILKERK